MVRVTKRLGGTVGSGQTERSGVMYLREDERENRTRKELTSLSNLL